jgi:Nif11 domain
MSKKDAEKFLKKLKADKTFAAEVTKASQEVIKLAKVHKLKFSRKELRAVLKEHWSKPDDDKDACLHPFSEAPGF